MDLKKPYHSKEPNIRDEFPGNFRENPFHIPEGYFNDLTGKLMRDKAVAVGEIHPKKAEWGRHALAIAAVIVILAGIISVIIHERMGAPETELPYFTISLKDFEQAYPLESLDEYTLVNYFSTSGEVPDMSFNNAFWNIVQEDSSLNVKDIQQYLLQSNEIENLLLEL